MLERTHRDLSAGDTAHIADTYHTWWGGDGIGDYADVPGFCKSVALEGILRHGWVLVWGRAPAPPGGICPRTTGTGRTPTAAVCRWRDRNVWAGLLEAVMDTLIMLMHASLQPYHGDIF